MTKQTRIILAISTFALGILYLGCEDSGDDTAGVGGDADADSDTDSDTDTDSDSDSDGDADGDSDGDGDGDSDGDGDGDTDICDEQDFTIEPKPVSLMLLLDYSSSMSSYPETPPSRWTQAVNAMTTLLGSWSNPYISFGLDYFPDGSGAGPVNRSIADCGVSNSVQMDCKSNNEQAIVNYLNQTQAPPTGGNMTPMWCGLNNFNNSTYAPGCRQDGAEPYVVLISDGSDTCGVDCNCHNKPVCGDPNYGANMDELGALAEMLCNNGVKTFVISFGGGADYYKLNAIATNGCTVLTQFLDAADGPALLAAFDKIAEAVVPCEYDINEPQVETDPDKVNFYFDDVVVPSIGDDGDCDTENGWQWVDSSHTKMRFCGDACTELKGGTVSKVTARFGCPTQVVE